jgi:uncharacterized protein (DUF302 family)
VTARRTRIPRRRVIMGAVFAASLLVGTAGCGASATGEEVTSIAPPLPAAGQPPGTVTLPVGSEMGSAVKKLQDAITAGGGVVLATIDNAADARATGAPAIPANTVVIGGATAVGLPMLRANQQAAAALPERYLLRQATGGAVSLTYNGPDYVAAVSGVVALAATNPFATATSSVVDQTAGVSGVHESAPLIGVTPKGFLLIAPGKATVPATVARLRDAIGAPGETVVADQDLAAGSADAGPALRATHSLLVSAPGFTTALVAAAPTFGLELPLRFVVWLDDKNTTQIGYVDVGVLAARHGLKADDPNVIRLAAECDRLAAAAAGQ